MEKLQKFGHVNRARHNKMLADRVQKALKELAFLFDNLPLYYKSKILLSKEGGEFVNVLSHVDSSKAWS